jgi:hypothetical protein
MLFLLALLALTVAQFLPGLVIVKLLDIGRDREEGYILSAVLAGPITATVYLVTLLADWEPLYWILIGNLGLLAVVVPWRRKRSFGWPRAARIALATLLVVLFVPYFLTTGSLYRIDANGTMLLDRALQTDVLFHLGVIHSLESAYPPSLLSLSGQPIGYHVGYHLQLAAWARYFGISAFDGLIRVATVWQVALLVASAFMLARRFTERISAHVVAPVLVFGAGFGFAFFFRPSVDWWSLVFMDATLVSIFLSNPLLPALPLLFAGLSLFDDYTRGSGRGVLVGSVVCIAFMLVVKMFLGAQVLAAMGIAAIVSWRDARMRVAFVALALASLPLLAHTFLAAGGSNTSIGLRPLELVRYSMEKLDWNAAIQALASVGRFELSVGAWALAAVATLTWGVGFLGVRLVGLGACVKDLWRGATPLRRTMAWFVAIGFPLALVFRIAPSESEGLSRLESQNDVLWFATASGVLLWFWTADALRRSSTTVIVTLLALTATVQHFVYAASLEPDRIAASRVRSAQAAGMLSGPDAIWLDPLDRSRPSLLPYISGRAVVYDPYVGYDYMFVGRDEIAYRRHAVAQFWSSGDPAYRAWMLDHFDVDFVWEQGGDVAPLRGLEPIYSDEAEHLYRVRDRAFRPPIVEMKTPATIPLGNRGSPYLGVGFRRADRVRRLAPERRAFLYLPCAEARSLRMRLRVDARHGGGELVVEGRRVPVELASTTIDVELSPREVSGLHAIAVEWRGERPLTILEILLR